MKNHIVFRIAAGIVLLAAIAGIAFIAYNAGITQGAAANLAQSGSVPGDVYRYGYGLHFFPPFFLAPFGFLACLIPLFLLFLAFGAFRRMLWGPRVWHGHGPMHHAPSGMHGEGVPPMFDEWHRRAHEPKSEPPAGQ